MNHMRIVLKTNKDLLGKRVPYFRRKRTFGKLREKYIRASEKLVKGPKATAEELRLIREKIMREEKERFVKTILVMVVLIVSLILIGSYLPE